MITLYKKYNEQGLTREEIRKEKRTARPVCAPVALSYVILCAKKIDMLDLTSVDQAYKDALSAGLTKFRTSPYKYLIVLNV
jgi:hypothetical protein